MDLRKLKTLIELVESSGIAELEINEGEERVRITRAGATAMQQVVAAPQPLAAPAAAPTIVESVLPVLPNALPAHKMLPSWTSTSLAVMFISCL